MYEKVVATLATTFVRSESLARILALAFESGKNVLLWGPGGHGKSEMVQAALACVAEEANIFVQSFGEGMDEATLWGGLDFAALERDKRLVYHPENSFLNRPYAVFEEMFDAPASVLLGLKDTLTARKLRKGSQVFAMKTNVIIAITNKNPDELSDIGPAAAALVERFPLQLKVDWPSYKSADYLELFHKVAPRLTGADLNGTTGVLAEVMAKASEGGEVVSPRTAVHALGIVKTAAALRGSSKVEKSDLLDLTFLPGMEAFAANLRAELDAAYERSQAEGRLVEAERKFQSLLATFNEAGGSPVKLLQVAKRLRSFEDEVAGLKVTDNLADRRKKLREVTAERAGAAQQAAFDNTRI
ncbi:MAG: AAA family ATPase [Candidatus Doudnabacteria bacterium]|nr:AAA family ATPase [Candidatus Doudnabacteria bacterium]